jgi:PilZ domain
MFSLKGKKPGQPVADPELVELSGKGGIYCGVLANFSRTSICVCMPRPIETGQRITLCAKQGRLTRGGTVRHCHSGTDGAYYVTVELDAAMERRKEPRYRVREGAMVTVLDRFEASRRRPGTLLDISKSGFSVLLDQWVSPGTHLLVALNEVALFGQVRNVRPHDGGGFIAGAAITEVVDAHGLVSSTVDVRKTNLTGRTAAMTRAGGD